MILLMFLISGVYTSNQILVLCTSVSTLHHFWCELHEGLKGLEDEEGLGRGEEGGGGVLVPMPARLCGA